MEGSRGGFGRVYSSCGLVAGEVDSISFWGDVWCKSRPLKDYFFPMVYGLAVLKEGPMAAFWDNQGWNIIFCLPAMLMIGSLGSL